MNKRVMPLSGLSASLLFAASASAGPVSATITADNHYAIYNVSGSTIGLVGGNEITYGGAPGQYNWSQAEVWNFESDDVLYIAAWSDDSVAQGLLAELEFGFEQLDSGHPRWEVIGTDQNLGDGDAHPASASITAYVANADLNNLWEAPYVGEKNGAEPWGTIAGISPDARWMWKNVPGDSDPLRGGSGASELLIFRISTSSIPTPGAASLLGLGGLISLRRRR